MNSWIKLKKRQARIAQTLEAAAEVLKKELDLPPSEPVKPKPTKGCGTCGNK